jgi:hypothetical protein
MEHFSGLKYPSYTVILCCVNLLIGLVGIFIISLIFISIRELIRSSNTTIKLVQIVLVVDFITCWTLILGPISTFIKPLFLFDFPVFCKLGHFIAGGSTFCSIWFLAIISLERFFLIVMDYKVPNKAWYTVVASLIILYTGMGIYCVFKDSIEPVALGVYCFVSPEHPEGLVLLYIVCIFNIISLLTVLISYICIAYKTLKFKNLSKIRTEGEVKEFQKAMQNACIKIIIIVTFYVLTNSFETYLELFELITKKNRSPLADLVAACLTNSNPLINAVLLLLINKDVGRSFHERFMKF